MALLLNTTNSTTSLSNNLNSLSFLNSFPQIIPKSSSSTTLKPFLFRSSSKNFTTISQELSKGNQINDEKNSDNSSSVSELKEKLSEQSSWETKDAKGNDYLYRLGAEADNMNIAVGAKSGVIDDLFAGNFLGKDADIVFDYRQKVTRSFEYLQGDYYIAPLFLDKVVCHIVKNFIAHLLNTKVPLILGIWGGKGQGKTFQTELIYRALGVEPVIISAGELESEKAGEPGKLIRERYRTASQVVQNQGKLSCLMVNDIDAGIGRFGDTQVTVNSQIVSGTLMNLADNPTRVSTGQKWRESDVTHRIPIIVTGNDFSTIYAPLIRDGRMEKFYWQPNYEDIINIVYRMYEKDGISRDEVVSIVNTFPNQALDFYGALRSRTYDRSLLKWVDDCGGVENLGATLLKKKKGEELPVFVPPEGKCSKMDDPPCDFFIFNDAMMEDDGIAASSVMIETDNEVLVSSENSDLSEEKRRRIVYSLTDLKKGNTFPYGAQSKLAAEFNVHKSTINYLFKLVREFTKTGGKIDVSNKRKGKCGTKRVYDNSGEWLESCQGLWWILGLLTQSHMEADKKRGAQNAYKFNSPSCE